MSDSSELKLDNLPDHILKIIFSWTEKEDDGNLRLVSRKFQYIFDETIGVCWGKYRKIKNNTEIEKFEGLPNCRKFFLQNKYYEQTPIAIPIFKRKHLLQYIYLNTAVTKSSLNNTLAGLTSLETLYLYHWGLNSLTGIYIKDLVNLKKLKLFVSALYPDSESLYFVLINFLKIAEFPCLHKLYLKIDDPSCENIFCDALLTFLIQHKKSMSKLVLMFWDMTQGEDWPALPDFHDRLNRLENHKLVKVRFLNRYLVNLTKLADIFDKIIMTGNMIEEANECPLFCWNGQEDPDYTNFYWENQNAPLTRIPMQMLKNNCSTLVIIGLNIMPEYCRPLDCSIFAPCSLLKELKLFTRLNSDAELTNATVLPRSLVTFEILHFQMKSEEIHSIATNNINLTLVYFGHTGTENGYGVKLESFTCFTARRTGEIIIINSWNLADVNESLHNRGPFHRMQALALLETNKVLVKKRYYSLFNREFRVRRIHAKVLIQPMKLVELGIEIADRDSGEYAYMNDD